MAKMFYKCICWIFFNMKMTLLMPNGGRRSERMAKVMAKCSAMKYFVVFFVALSLHFTRHYFDRKWQNGKMFFLLVSITVVWDDEK